MDAVNPSSDVFIVAQGLLMYLAPERVRQLFVSIADRFPGSVLVFDTIPRWFSDLTLVGLNLTASYRLPSMPWGINRDEVEPTLRRWHPHVATVAFLSYLSPRGLPRLFAGMTNQIPVARHGVPSLVYVTFGNAHRPSRSASISAAYRCYLSGRCALSRRDHPRVAVMPCQRSFPLRHHSAPRSIPTTPTICGRPHFVRVARG
jgi:hypothetical protein